MSRLKVDINSIETTKNQMESSYNELIDMINKYRDMIEDTKNVYDTESGNLYRNVAVGYVEYASKYINNSLKLCIDNLDSIKKTYIELYGIMNNSTKGE